MDNCATCGHPWHGLTCEHKSTKVDSEYRYTITEKCKCPGPFPSYDEGPRTVSKKGTW